jgi:hypothetical protein
MLDGSFEISSTALRSKQVERCGHLASVPVDHRHVNLDRSDGAEPVGPVVRPPRRGEAALRAAPRLTAAVLAVAMVGLSAAGGIPGIPAGMLDWLWLPLSAVAIPSSPKRWWRYVKHGTPTPWQVSHSGTTCLTVTDPGRKRVQVAARLREHGPLDLREALQRMENPTRPIWNDLTADSANRLRVILEQTGATVRVEPRS